MFNNVVCIVGRSNVGKSTLFNKIISKKVSIVDDTYGVTRDRICIDTHWQNKQFTLIDTGGITYNNNDLILKETQIQTEIAIDLSTLVLFVVDYKQGLTTYDEIILQNIKKKNKKIILVINKVDGHNINDAYNEFYKLGIDNMFCVSAEHSLGLGDLLDCICNNLNDEEETTTEHQITISIVGQPNSGKSSIYNKILGCNRSIVSNIAGTTRDSIEEYITYNNYRIKLIDTSGLRKTNNINSNIEYYSMLRTILSIKQSDICILIIDANIGITEQDLKICSEIINNNKSSILVMNKCDLLVNKEEEIKKLNNDVKLKLPFMHYNNILYVSALTGKHINKILDLCINIYNIASSTIQTAKINNFIYELVNNNPPQQVNNKRLKIYYCNQTNILPPVFIIFVNDVLCVTENYKKYLKNKIIEKFNFYHIPIKLIFKGKQNI